jgi:predicted secreted protein
MKTSLFTPALFTATPPRARALAACSLALLGTVAQAQVLPPPQNVVNLSATASVEVARDWLTVVFSTTREGAEAATVQSQLKQALDAALAEARKGAKPAQLEVQTGGFSLTPRYAPPNPKTPGMPGGINGWQGRTELIVEGRDVQAIAQLTSRIQSMSIARVGFSLSREARDKVEGEVAAQAIASFRARAESMSRQFGFGSYTLREVNVGSDGSQPMAMAAAPRMLSARSVNMEDAALPVEAGKQLVSATVSGSVQLVK